MIIIVAAPFPDQGAQTRRCASGQQGGAGTALTKLLARVMDLRNQGATAQTIAQMLNAEGWTPPEKDSFNAPMIHRLLQRRGLGTTRPIWSGNVPRQHDGEVTLQEYDDRVGAHRQTVYGWLRADESPDDWPRSDPSASGSSTPQIPRQESELESHHKHTIEGFFAKLPRRRLKNGVFYSVVDLQAAINRFIREYNAASAKPFIWKAKPYHIIAARNRGFRTLKSIH